MFTTSYKGFYIHGYCCKPACSVIFKNSEKFGEFKSLRTAKVAITKFNNQKGELA